MKKISALFFVFILSLFLVACGGDDENNDNNNNVDQNEQTEDQNTTEENDSTVDDDNEQTNGNDEQDDEANDDTNNQTETASIGDTLNYDNLEITLNEAYTSEGGQFESPSNDHYLILDLTITNTSDESENVSTLLQMSVQDDEGYTYDVTIFTETKGSLDGEIGPGRNVRGEVAFDVDASDNYEFIFEDPFASGQAIWSFSVNE